MHVYRTCAAAASLASQTHGKSGQTTRYTQSRHPRWCRSMSLFCVVGEGELFPDRYHFSVLWVRGVNTLAPTRSALNPVFLPRPSHTPRQLRQARFPVDRIICARCAPNCWSHLPSHTPFVQLVRVGQLHMVHSLPERHRVLQLGLLRRPMREYNGHDRSVSLMLMLRVNIVAQRMHAALLLNRPPIRPHMRARHYSIHPHTHHSEPLLHAHPF